MFTPAFLFFTIFSYIPMVGIITAFKKFSYQGGIFGSPWCGFDNFKFFFLGGKAFSVISNTLLFNIAFITVNTVLEIAIAILLVEISSKWFKKITQTVMLLPYFISWVVVGAIIFNIFSYEYGSLNSFLTKLGIEPFDAYSTVWIWKYILVAVNSWKWVGYGSIIYLAAIMGIDTEMYSAADIDGANRIHKIFYITLPMLKPQVIILTLIALGNVFRGDFQMFYQVIRYNSMLLDSTDVIDTYVVRTLTTMQDFGMSAAVGVLQSVFGFVLLVTVNKIIKKVESEYSLF